MDKELLIYKHNGNYQYEISGVFDAFESLIIYDNFHEFNSFDLKVPYSKQAMNLLQINNIIKFEGLNYYIDDISGEGNYIRVLGNSLGGKTEDRIIDKVYIASKSPALIAYDHISQNVTNPSTYTDLNGNHDGTARKINFLTVANNDGLGLAAIDYQNSYGVVKDEVEALSLTYNFGIKETGSTTEISNEISFYSGKDVSSWVVFSDDPDGYENLTNASYKHSIIDFKNTAYTFGEGEGTDRAKIVVNPDNVGMDRKEVYIDAREIQSTNTETGVTVTAEAYKNMLITKGQQKLSERNEVLTLDGDFLTTSKLVKYQTDFNVGDTVKIISYKYGVEKTAVITQAKTTYDSKGKHIEFIYDRDLPTIFDYIERNIK